MKPMRYPYLLALMLAATTVLFLSPFAWSSSASELRVGDTDLALRVPSGWQAHYVAEESRLLVKEIPMQLLNANLAVQVHANGTDINRWREYHRDQHIPGAHPASRIRSETEITSGGKSAVLFHVIDLPGAFSKFDLLEAIVRVEDRWVTVSILFDGSRLDRYEKIIRDVVESIRVDSDGDAMPILEMAGSNREHRPGEITWHDDLAAALAEAKRRGVPVMVAIHHASQPVCRQLLEKHYRDREIVELSRNMVVLLAEASEHEDDALYGGVSSAAHQQIEMQVRETFLDTDTPIAPQHLWISSDGRLLLQKEYMVSPQQLRSLMLEAIHENRRDSGASKADPIRGPLARYLEAESAAVRASIVRALFLEGRALAIEHLVDGVTRKAKAKTDRLIELVQALGVARSADAVPHVARFLSHRAWQVREAAAIAASEISEPAAVESLLGRLSRERNAVVKAKLIEAAALCGHGDHDIATKILAYTKTGTTSVRIEAIVALRHFPDDLLVADRLLDILRQNRTEQLRAAAAWSLAWFDVPGASDVLAKAANRGKRGKYASIYRSALRQATGEPGAHNEHEAALGMLRESTVRLKR